jgi:hypothetical protein
MGLEIEYTDSRGRKHRDMAGMLDAEFERVVDDELAGVKRAIESQRCQVHGEHATATLNRSGDQISFDISGCCEELVERAQAAASNA